KIPHSLDVLFSNMEGYPPKGMHDPAIGDWIASQQITADGWYVSNPNMTVAEAHRLERVGKAVAELLGKDGERRDAPMSSVEEDQESARRNPSAGAPTLELQEIQAVLLRPRPAPYVGTYVLLRVDAAQAGRKFLSRLAPHIASSTNWWKAANTWLAVGISY